MRAIGITCLTIMEMKTVRVNVKKILQSSFAAALVGGLGLVGAQADEHGRSEVLHLPNPYGDAVLEHANPHRNGGGGSGISYHGGPVMLGTVHAYAIWYGTWTQNGADLPSKTIITDFLNSVGGSPYYRSLDGDR